MKNILDQIQRLAVKMGQAIKEDRVRITELERRMTELENKVRQRS